MYHHTRSAEGAKPAAYGEILAKKPIGETALTGGRTTPSVVRVGETVRRPGTANSAFVERLLQHLEVADFIGTPRALGRDDQGRDILSYIAGDVPADLGWYDDRVLAKAARLIRAYPGAAAALAGGDEVICHNDLSPCNFVFREAKPVAIIDFDAAAAGTRSSDIGYAAWLWLDIGNSDIEATEQWRRLVLFVGAYGDLSPDGVLQAMVARQGLLLNEGQRTGDAVLANWAAQCLTWTERWR